MWKESLDGGRIKGGMLKSHLDWAQTQGFPGGLAAVRERVSEQTARIIDGPLLPISWYPFRALIETDRAIASLAGRNDPELFVELGRHSARLNLGTSYRFYNRSRPHDFFASVARMHHQYLDFGREEYSNVGATACRIVLTDYSCYSKVYCWSALGYYEQATALQGGHEPRVSERECACQAARVCRFEIEWT